jgi:hypothetical protein
MDTIIVGIVAIVSIAAGFSAGCYYEQHKQGILSALQRAEALSAKLEVNLVAHANHLKHNANTVATATQKIVEHGESTLEAVKTAVESAVKPVVGTEQE